MNLLILLLRKLLLLLFLLLPLMLILAVSCSGFKEHPSTRRYIQDIGLWTYANPGKILNCGR